MILIGADHAGLAMKEFLKKFFEKNHIEYTDLGPHSLDPKDDYTDYAKKVARGVQKSRGKAQGILICGSGVGMSIAANRFTGIRAALVCNTKMARLSKEHNHSNVLCLANWFITNKEALSMLKEWLKTPYSKEKRHVRRVKKMEN